MKRWSILSGGALLLLSLLLMGCGELEFGIETRLTSGRPDGATVVVTATQQSADNMVLVTVTPVNANGLSETETPTPAATMTATGTAMATETATPIPTMMPSATATNRPFFPTATPEPPRIFTFTAEPSPAVLNSTISATWSAFGESALLCLKFISGWTDNCYDVPTNGTRTLWVEGHFREDILLELEVTNAAGETVETSLYVPLDCPDEMWFFDDPPESCPSAEAVDSNAAVQHFEGGWMLWIGETDTIYTFYEPERTYSVFYSGFGDPDDPAADNSDYDPPDGFYVPKRGFGLVWRNYAYVRESMGWALAPESGFETTYQSSADPNFHRLFFLDENGRLVGVDTWFSTWGYQD